MPFAIGDRNPARNPGDFQIERVGDYNPTDLERGVIASFTRTLDRLAEQAAVDASTPMRARILQARAAFRAAQIANLRTGAQAWIDRADPGTADRIAEIAGQIDADLPDVILAVPPAPRFEGDFTAAVRNYALEDDERAYLDAQRACVDNLAIDDATDARADYTDAGLRVRRTQRADAIARLKDVFASWKSEQRASSDAADRVSWVRGYYTAQRARLTRKLFTVRTIRGTGGEEEARHNVALDIRMTEGLPPPDDQPSQDQRDLFVGISHAETVIGAVCRQIRARAHSRFWARPEEDQRGLRLLGEYIDKLAGIAGIGLAQSHTTLAKLALDSLREEFIAREAGEILNRYVRRLGAWSFGFAALFLVVYVLVRSNACTVPDSCASWWFLHRSFLLAAAGASFGTWASFSVRQVNLTFEQLATPEEQLLDAPLRVIFVVLLTMAACLLFWTSAINVKIGDLNTEASSFSKIGSAAILIGFFCGLSERALSSAIAGRATAFIGGIAGGR